MRLSSVLEGEILPKYLVQASYTADGLKGVIKDTASGRRAAVTHMVEALGGTVEGFYFSLGDYDALIVVDAPDTTTVAGLCAAASASGVVRTSTTALLSVEEMDQALAKPIGYKPPGSA